MVDYTRINTSTNLDFKRPQKLKLFKVVPLNGDERGIILPPPVHPATNAIGSRSHAPEHLRAWCLLWDRLELPDNNLISGLGTNADTAFLESAGVLNRSMVGAERISLGAREIFHFHNFAYDLLDSREPGRWSMATDGPVSAFDEDRTAGRGLLVKLTDAIPLPAGEVPLQDVLEFKARRRSELLALRSYLEDAYQRILTAGDVDLAALIEFERLDRAIAEHVQVTKEARFPVRFGGFSSTISLGDLITLGGTTSGLVSFGMPAATAALAGLGVAFAKQVVTNIEISAGFSSKRERSAFDYITQINKELTFHP